MADQRRRTVLLGVHLLAFLLVWSLDLLPYIVNGESSRGMTLVVLLWMPALMAHVGVYLYYAGQGRDRGDEQAAYRQGFRDAVHDLAASGRLADVDPERHEERAGYGDRLVMDDEESVFFDSGEKPKRQRSR